MSAAARASEVESRLDAMALLQAQPLVRELRAHAPYPSIRDAEFRVFSQFGDDGIIQYLAHSTGAADSARTFVEFGVADYRESNTRFLLENDNWSGLVLDGSAKHIAAIRERAVYWRHDLEAREAFVTRENIDGLLAQYAPARELGLLSIDIDGNDYWVWEAVESVAPRVVVVEYNSIFGCDRALTVPYEPGFDRVTAHYSGLYFGASVKALALLGREKGYDFVGCNSAGNNAYFVREGLAPAVPRPSLEEAFVPAKVRESRDPRGRLTFLSGEARVREIADLPVVDLEAGGTVALGRVLNP